ncbi:beta-ketoacyl reductase, partial [Streptomyces sedi]|uniref:beta-ketoacyl reductase n=1 Tax=Streptomyces sedi TaxID=555059 RepID=UPI0031EA04CD
SYRRANGQVGLSLAWGLWAQSEGITGQLDDADRARMARSGLEPIESDQGLALFDASLALSEPVLVPVRLNMSAVRATVRAGIAPALLSGLVPTPSRRTRVPQTSPSALAERLADLSEDEQDRLVLELLRAEMSTVLGYGSASDEVDTSRGFLELGFDSLMTVELRNRLNVVTGLR